MARDMIRLVRFNGADKPNLPNLKFLRDATLWADPRGTTEPPRTSTGGFSFAEQPNRRGYVVWVFDHSCAEQPDRRGFVLWVSDHSCAEQPDRRGFLFLFLCGFATAGSLFRRYPPLAVAMILSRAALWFFYECSFSCRAPRFVYLYECPFVDACVFLWLC